MSAKQTKERTAGDKHHAKEMPCASTKAAALARWNERRFDFGKKFAVVIYGEDGRDDFHLFVSKKEAHLYFFRVAYAVHSKTKVRDIHDELVTVRGARIYEVNCDDEELARDRIARGDALRLHDTDDLCAGVELIVPALFRIVQ